MAIRRIRGTSNADTLFGDLGSSNSIYSDAVSGAINGGASNTLLSASYGETRFDHIADFGARERIDFSNFLTIHLADTSAGLLAAFNKAGGQNAMVT